MAKKKPDTAEKTMTKAEVVRQAVANGHDLPKAAVAYIKSEFGIDISTGTFSSNKSQ